MVLAGRLVARTGFTAEKEEKDEMLHYGRAAEGLKTEDNGSRQESGAIDF